MPAHRPFLKIKTNFNRVYLGQCGPQVVGLDDRVLVNAHIADSLGHIVALVWYGSGGPTRVEDGRSSIYKLINI